LHYGDLRIDLTTSEFLKLENVIKSSLEDLIEIENFELKYFDPSFIKSISGFLPDLIKVAFESIDINQLVIQRKGFLDLPVLSSISQSRVLKALNGDVEENNSYNQSNILNKTNQQRVEDVYQLIKEKGYPYDNKYMILFNNQNIIRDGQHRAASLIHKGTNGEIPIIRLYFKDNNHNISKRPWMNVVFKGIASILRRAAGKIYRTLRGLIN
jgi:hypothetical protein